MKRITQIISIIVIASLALSSCKQDAVDATGSFNGIYYWKTTFRMNETDSLFLAKQGITRLYLHLFDVDEEKGYHEEREAVPVGTLRFESKIPKGIEIVPTVFITLQALCIYDGREEDLARLVTKRMLAMCSYNDIEGVREFQFDCDWTADSRERYERLCKAAKDILHPLGISLSGTIRLHQIEEAVYPFDRGVLMLYNTGAIKDPRTVNSIISYEDVKKYVGVNTRADKFKKARKKNCPQIDFAYPTFCWGVCYHEDGSFDGILRSVDFDTLPWLEKRGNRYYVKETIEYDGEWFLEGQFVRPEYSDIKEVLKVKDLVDRTIRMDKSSNIIFHLDQRNLSKYKSDEITKILR